MFEAVLTGDQSFAFVDQVPSRANLALAVLRVNLALTVLRVPVTVLRVPYVCLDCLTCALRVPESGLDWLNLALTVLRVPVPGRVRRGAHRRPVLLLRRPGPSSSSLLLSSLELSDTNVYEP